MNCKVPHCTYDMEEDIDKTSKVSEHLQLLMAHVDAVHPKPLPQPVAAQQPAPVQAKTEKIACPKLEMKDGSSSEEQWDFFSFRWYKTIANIIGNAKERLGVCLGDMVACMVYARLRDKR